MSVDTQNWLNYIEKLHPKTMDLGLKRIQIVAQRLGILPFDCPVITVAGTNGKGSCVATLESIFTAAGYRVGAYYSPHLQYYNERIRIMNQMVTDHALCEAFSAIESARDDISLTYFEWGTLAALWLFKKANLEVVVLEVGLGGRLDAVNMIDADVSVITTIDYDHMEWLGNDLESIGKEKAGIFRQKKPAVFGDFRLPNSVRDIALTLNTPLYRQGIDFGYEIQNNAWYFWHNEIKTPLLPIPSLLLQNVATALMVLTLLNSRLPISNPALLKGISCAFLPGRFQKISDHPLIILDVAHNPASCQQLAIRLQQTSIKGKTYAIVGMLSDKDPIQSLAPLLPTIDVWHVTSLPGERGAPASRFTPILKNLGACCVYPFDSVIDAYQDALNQATINDRIVVFGSFHTISPILNYYFKE